MVSTTPLTSTVKSSLSHMLIPVHSPWLPGYIDVVIKTILVLLTMAGLFPEIPCIYIFLFSRFKLLSLSFVSDTFIIICLGDLFELNFLVSYELYELGYLNVFPDLGNSSHYFFKQFFCPFLSAPSGTPLIHSFS